MGWMQDETGLGKRAANYVPLTPLSHLQRAARIFTDREAIIYGNTRLTYADYYRRVSQLGSALVKIGVQPGDVVEHRSSRLGTIRVEVVEGETP